METLIKLFFEKEIDDLQFKFLSESDKNDESNAITLIQKFIFKQDVVADFKQLLQSICWSEEITIQNEITEKTIQRLVSLLSSKANDDIKVKVFHYFFRAFVLSSKENEENVIQFFIVLVFLVGLDFSSGNDPKKPMGAIKKEIIEKALKVKITEPSSVSYKIVNKLLLEFSQLSININSPDNLKYHSWFSELIKNITSQPFDTVFLEIFSTSCDIDVKLFEGNLQLILVVIFSQQKCNDPVFDTAYKSFLLKTFKICAKFQRSQKFISRFFDCLKSVNPSLAKEVILPEEFLVEFSNVIKMMSSQQSLSIFETLLQHLDEIFSLVSHDTLDVGETFVSSIVEVAKRFFEEVKIFSPSLSAASATLFIEKLKLFKNTLQKYTASLSENTELALNNDTIFLSFLDLCYYCTELEVLINCYKDFFLDDLNSSDKIQVLCIDTELWNSIVKLVLKSKLTKCYSVCLQIALQRLRILKLNQKSITMEEPTQKMIVSSFLSDEVGTTSLNFVSPEDITLIMEVSTKKQQKKIVKRVLKEIFLNLNTKLAWLSDSRLQENVVFVVEIFSNLMNETYKNFNSCLDHKIMSKFNWLSQEYFDENNIFNSEVLETLPETINTLFKKLKVKKIETETLEKDESLLKIVEVFRRLPLVHLNPKCSRLGLSFAMGISTVCVTHKKTMPLLLECILNFLNSDLDPSICFNVGLSIKWLSDLYFEDKNTDELRIKLIETLVRSCRNSKFGLSQVGEMIEAPENVQQEKQLRTLETQVTIYFELGKCLTKKRKADNELIGNYRNKLAKVISEKANDMSVNGLGSDNYKVLFRIGAANLNRALKSNNKDEIIDFIQKKFGSYFEWAVNNLKTEYDDSSVLLLSTILQGVPAMRNNIPGDTLHRIWVVFKKYEKIPWRFFTTNSTEEEFDSILSDLLHITKTFLDSNHEVSSANCFEIWKSFFEASEDAKTNRCQIALQKLFDYIIDCDFLINDFQIKKKYFLIKFLSFCLTNRKVILTSQMMDTVVHLILQSSNEKDLKIQDFHDLFVVRVETCSAILSGEFAWNKNKVHLIYDLFQHLLFSFTSKCNSNLNINNDDIFLLSVCALSLEKWAGLMIGKQKHFARIGAYFIASIISCVASVTLFPAVKIHLVNCLNHFLSISDSHTYSYLLRILKPGYQQVFSSMYEQFKKYHKFTGKV